MVRIHPTRWCRTVPVVAYACIVALGNDKSTLVVVQVEMPLSRDR